MVPNMAVLIPFTLLVVMCMLQAARGMPLMPAVGKMEHHYP
jgi:hypothetical protein